MNKYTTSVKLGPWVHSKYGLITKQRGIICAAVGGIFPAAGGQGTLALTTLFASVLQFGQSATAGVRVLTTGNVEELSNSGWNAQNSSTEWIDAFDSDTSSDYEVQLTTGSIIGNGSMSGPARGQYWTISTTRQWTLQTTQLGSVTYTGSMLIREIANTSNNVSADCTITASWDTF